MKIHITKDFLSGALFGAIGLGTIAMGVSYRLGTPGNMGPGYFPVMLGVIMALIGLTMLIRSMLNPEASDGVASWEVRPLVFVLAAVFVFSLLIDSLGVIVAVASLVLIGRLGGREGSMSELAVMIVAMTVLAVGIFVYGLNIPLKLRPW
ncbi:tripartite tricarboxylate transporter TctB family protein [Pseudochelatococcus sp. B33]